MQTILSEIPSELKQLAKLVVRGFYDIECSLVIDMLVRYHCMRENDLCDILKCDKKFLRCKLATLKADKFVVMKLKIETREDGKAVKMNCWFINYRIFVNIVKYKLDNMRKKMETEERDVSSRSRVKCVACRKQFTDLEADQLFDPMSGEFRCVSLVNQIALFDPYPPIPGALSMAPVSRRTRPPCPRRTPGFSWPSSMSKWRSSTICCG